MLKKGNIVIKSYKNVWVAMRKCCMKTSSDCADVMWNGRWFQVLVLETGNACVLTVERGKGSIDF